MRHECLELHLVLPADGAFGGWFHFGDTLVIQTAPQGLANLLKQESR